MTEIKLQPLAAGTLAVESGRGSTDRSKVAAEAFLPDGSSGGSVQSLTGTTPWTLLLVAGWGGVTLRQQGVAFSGVEAIE